MGGIWTTTRLFPVLTSVEYDGSLTLGGCSKLTGISFFPVFSLESCYPPAEARHKHVPLPKLQQAESPLKSSVAQSFGAPISIQSLLVGWELCPRYDRSRILGPDCLCPNWIQCPTQTRRVSFREKPPLSMMPSSIAMILRSCSGKESGYYSRVS